jgi:hypothetical protein
LPAEAALDLHPPTGRGRASRRHTAPSGAAKAAKTRASNCANRSVRMRRLKSEYDGNFRGRNRLA